MPARLRERSADGGRAGVVRPVDRQPQQTACPVGQPGEPELALQRLEQRRAGSRRHREPPQRPSPGQQGHVADLAPERNALRGRQLIQLALVCEQCFQALDARAHRGRRSLEAQDREIGRGRGDGRDGRACGGGRRQTGRAGDIARAVHGPAQRSETGGARARPHQERGLVLGRRQHLEGHLGHGDQGAEAAGEQLAQIIAGDVLHDPAAGLDRVAAPGHRAHAEEVIARGAGLDPTRAREVAGDHAADRAAPRFAAKQRAVIRRLERELLLVVGEAGLDLGQRRADLRRHHELGRLVQADAAEAIETDLGLRLDRPAVAALGARAEDLERRLVRCGRSHDLPQLLGGARPDLVRHTPRPAPADHPRAAGRARRR